MNDILAFVIHNGLKSSQFCGMDDTVNDKKGLNDTEQICS